MVENFLDLLKNVTSLDELENLRVEYFGKKGLFTALMKELGSLTGDERASKGKELNLKKQEMVEAFDKRKDLLQKEQLKEKLMSEKIDLSLPSRSIERGSKHPISIMMEEVLDIFSKMSFDIAMGPEIESVENNFDLLNVPEEHPSRNASDTFYFSPDELLRTQTTTVQVRTLKSKKPPIRVVSYGKVYRPDYDASHTPMFHQIEGIFVEKNVTFANLKATLEKFIKTLFPNVGVRFRPHFFPFTEPSVEVDMSCPSCLGSGCSLCKKSGWIEMLGAGMIHLKILKQFNLEGYSGFAFGMGVERLAMIKFGLSDIRLLYENDLRLLKQF